MKLNLGCGNDIREGWVNVDRKYCPGVNIVCEIEKSLPMPFEDGSIEYIVASHFLEHIRDWTRPSDGEIFGWEEIFMDVYRMLKPGGIFEVRCPADFQPSAYHRHYFSRNCLDPFIEYSASGKTFRSQSKTLHSLDKFLDFEVLSLRCYRRFPFRWHIMTYLKINVPERSRFGTKIEYVWMLKKPDKFLKN